MRISILQMKIDIKKPPKKPIVNAIITPYKTIKFKYVT